MRNIGRPSNLERSDLFLESGEELVFAGVSSAVTGHFALGKGVDVIGVNLAGPGKERQPVRLGRSSEQHSYVVLARDATDEERAAFYRQPYIGKPCVAAVELLLHMRTEQDRAGIPRVIFARTGKVKVYVSI